MMSSFFSAGSDIKGLILFWEELIPDVARRWRQTNATRLTPDCFIDFLFVADFQATGRFCCDEDRVTHYSARTTVLGFNFLPKPKASKFEFRTLFRSPYAGSPYRF